MCYAEGQRALRDPVSRGFSGIADPKSWPGGPEPARFTRPGAARELLLACTPPRTAARPGRRSATESSADPHIRRLPDQHSISQQGHSGGQVQATWGHVGPSIRFFRSADLWGLGGCLMDLLDCAEDHRRGALDGPAHQVPRAVAVLYLGEPLLDRHGLAVRAGGHVAARQHAG